MVDAPPDQGQLNSPADIGEPGPATTQRRWASEIDVALKDRKEFFDGADKTQKRYLDKRNTQQSTLASRRAKFNVLWSNVQTLMPALYAKAPKPYAERRYKDGDPIGRAASQILERVLTVQLEDGFDQAMRRCVLDYTLVAQGIGWVCQTNVAYSEQGGEASIPIDQEVHLDYVHWRDFLTNPARTWDEVTWVARRHWYEKTELVELFGQEIADKVPLEASGSKDSSRDTNRPEHELWRKAEVWEVWDKSSRTRKFINVGYGDAPLKEDADPFGLEDFFPCPRPMLGTCTNDSVVPVPDYLLYEDQARQLDVLTQRIDGITQACRVVGTYDKAFPDLARLPTKPDNTLIPVDNFAQFAKNNGFVGTVAFLPIDQFVAGLQVLMEQRQLAKSDLYEITGISDIIRGSTQPTETATAQQIKGQFANLRLSDRQAEVQRFARDVVRIMGNVIAKKFMPDVLLKMAGVPTSADPNMQKAFQQAIALLHDDAERDFRIDIETDSMVVIDEQAEKQSRTEFLTAVGTFIEKIAQIAPAAPQMMPLFMEMLQFGVRSFKAGRDLETVFEQAKNQVTQAAQQAAQNPPQQPPDPKVIEAQAKAKESEQSMAMAAQKHQQEMQQAQETHQQKMQESAMALRQKGIEANAAESEQIGLPADGQDPRARLDMLQQSLAVMQQAIAAMAQAQAQTSAQIGQVAAIAAAPRKSVLERGADGRPQSATSMVVMPGRMN